MVFLRWGLFSVLLTLLWWAPHAEVNSADGYHLEQTAVDAGLAAERPLPSEEPDTAAVPAALKRFSVISIPLYPHASNTVGVAQLAPQQARAPPRRFAINV